METITTSQQVYMVIGVERTGSGSLTWPESFDIAGAFFNYDEAQEWANAKNADAGFVYDENGDLAEDEDQPDEDEREYYVETLDVLALKK
jgi:hypothetical protein